MAYRIYSKYQHLPNKQREVGAVIWSKWYPLVLEAPEDKIRTIKERVNELRANTKRIDRATKLRHEYEIRDTEE